MRAHTMYTHAPVPSTTCSVSLMYVRAIDGMTYGYLHTYLHAHGTYYWSTDGLVYTAGLMVRLPYW
jgi:hypothetical protein